VIGILDRFILKKFFGTFLFMILAFVIIAVVFDVSENIDDLLKSKATGYEIIVHYYLNFCLYFGTLLSSFIIFLTVIWFTSKMSQRTEIIAMLASGISYSRILRPFLIASFFLCGLSLVLGHYVVPYANKKKFEFEVKYLKDQLTIQDINIHREIEPGLLAYFHRYNPKNNGGSQFSIERWENGELTFKLMSASANFNLETNQWMLNNVQVRRKDGNHEKVIFKPHLDTILEVKPEDFGLRSEVVSTMNWDELNTFIEEQRLSGSGNVAKFELERENRTAGPFGIIILTLIGVSIASRKSRGGIGLHLALAVIIGFIFVFISRVTAVSAMNLGVPTLMAVWIPNFVFGILAFVLLKRAQK
jgi:lipopolysaccharide export system permease protein